MTGSARAAQTTSWTRAALAAVIGVVAFAYLAHVAGALGLTWDEAQYMVHARDMGQWLHRLGTDAFDGEVLKATFYADPFHNPHPPLPKLLAAVSDALLPQSWPSFLRMRLAMAAATSATLVIVFVLVDRRLGPFAGVAAVLGVLAQPRLVAHGVVLAHDGLLACAVVIALLAAATVVAEDGRWPRALLALAVTAALFTKLSALHLGLPLLLVAAVHRRPAVVVVAGAGAVLALVLLAVFHPPWVLAEQGAMHSQGTVAVLLLSTFYSQGPAWWLPVMLVVVPPLTWLLALVAASPGMVAQARAREPLAVALGGALVLWALTFLLPQIPRHDGIRQALFFFFVAGVCAGAWAAIGLERLLARVDEARLPTSKTFAARGGAVVLLLGATFNTLGAEPYWLQSFSGLIGGARGAAERGFEVTYWLDVVTPAVRAELNEHLPEAATLADSQTEHYIPFLLEQGLLRSDLVHDPRGEWMLMQNRPTSFTERHQQLLALPPTRTWTVDGASVLQLVKVPPGFWKSVADDDPTATKVDDKGDAKASASSAPATAP